MRRIGVRFLQTIVGLMFVYYSGQAAEDKSAANPPDYQEVYDLIRDHLEGMKPGELDKVAVEALVAKLAPKVALLGGPQSNSNNEAPLVKTSNLFEGNVGYLRIA